MADSVNILQNAEKLEIAPLFNTYAKVILNIDDETQASAGSGNGRVLEMDNPLFGSATVANKLLTRLRGYQYQPFKASGALLDPSAEMGDGISANSVYGGIFSQDKTFGHLMLTDVAAPCDEEIDHEYQFETPTDRKIRREMGNVRATFVIQNNKIEARVAKTGGNNSSFGWVLDDTSHTWYSGNRQVMKVNSSGLEITGKVTATSGYIGNSSNGFEITNRAIRNGMESRDDTTHNGIYLGTDGIALGRGNFKVDSSGNLTAKRGTFGSLSVTSGGSSYSGGLSGCGGSVSGGLSFSSGGSSSTLGGLKSRVDTIEANYITANYIQANYGAALSGTFADLTVAHNTWSYVNLTVVTGVNFDAQTVNTTTRRFWITEGY